MTPSPSFAFSSGFHDRASALRTNAEWLSQALQAQTTRVLLMRSHSQLLVASETQLGHWTPADLTDASDLTFLGLDGNGHAVFVADAGERETPAHLARAADATFAELRALAATLGEHEAAMAAQAVAMVGWHRRHRFCGVCGGETASLEAGHSRKCTRCGSSNYPRTDPAVIMLVTAGDRAVLGKRRAAVGRGSIWTCLSGFVEPGETFEAAVAREVLEEVGVRVTSATYRGAQPWPFPLSLMIAFDAEAEYGPLVVDEELEAARWFTRDEVRAALVAGEISLPGSISVASFLVRSWLDKE